MTQLDEGQTYCWIDGPAALAEIADDWRALAEITGADVYMIPDWTLTWWTHFGAGRTLTALVARRADGSLAGLLPFMIDTIRIGPLPIRVARLAATDPHAVILALPVAAEILHDMLTRAVSDLLGGVSAPLAVTFTPASERGPLLDAVRAIIPSGSTTAAFTGKQELRCVDRKMGTHTAFELPKTFDDYLAALSKKRRSQFRRDLKNLREAHGMTAQFRHPDARDFAEFVTFHDKQWRETGKGGHFTDWRGSAAFYSDLSDRLQPRGNIWLDRQDSAAGPLAAQFSLVSDQVCHWRLPARTIDPELDRLSVGKVGLILMIERLIANGVRRIEAGVGAYDYKLVYGGEAVPVHRLIVTRATLSARLQLALLLGWARLLHLSYYRLWFGRLAPRLRKLVPWPHRPLWASWIRSRI